MQASSSSLALTMLLCNLSAHKGGLQARHQAAKYLLVLCGVSLDTTSLSIMSTWLCVNPILLKHVSSAGVAVARPRPVSRHPARPKSIGKHPDE